MNAEEAVAENVRMRWRNWLRLETIGHAAFWPYIVGCIVGLMIFPIGSPAQEGAVPSNELTVSEDRLDWRIIDASYESHGHAGFRRHCPIIVATGKDTALACHVNANGRFSAWEIRGSEAFKLLESDWFTEKGAQIRNWPDLVVKNGQIMVIAIGEKSFLNQDYVLIFFTLDPVAKKLVPFKEITLTKQPCFRKSSSYWLEGVVAVDPREDSYLIAGGFDETYLTKYGILLNTEGTFSKNCTMWLRNNTNSSLQRVEVPGRFYAVKTDFAVGQKDHVHCVWVRRDKLCYSTSLIGSSWAKPTILYPERGPIRFQLGDVSVASVRDRAFVLWMLDEEGVYFTQMIGLRRGKTEKIGEWQEYSSIGQLGTALAGSAPSADLVVDKSGNVFAIWVLNKTEFPKNINQHRLVIKVRMNGVWLRELIISNGPGVIRSPSILVDDWGQIHIGYLKQAEGNFFACYYRKLTIGDLTSLAK